jgi:ribokinase
VTPAGFAVVGHVDWVEFVRVGHVPAAGEIVSASRAWEEPGGGGTVAAVQLACLAGRCEFFTALAGDALGARAAELLASRGVAVHAAPRPSPQRRTIVHIDDAGERTITAIGDRMIPRRRDALPWDTLADADAVYFTGGDALALRAARAARVLVATPRAADALRGSGVLLDALVGSGADPAERLGPEGLDPPPRLVVATLGAHGGRWEAADGRSGAWEATPLPGPFVSSYGAGDAFAGALTFGLATLGGVEEAVALAADCGAARVSARRVVDADPGPDG